ncbi:BTAD domain-containing putative transcriptional regulator [Dactylosporangium sp. CA-233914]|uniref:BTAD domain-containing putative transcriptional regulator n=1 Tax=Dactylosporangium sp. CA-233914 TaxID=3239934 RepID=UPI003D8E1CAB
MEFGLLGPVEVRHMGRLLPGGSGRERLVLATLLINAERLNSADELIARLWEHPPGSARAQLHNLISGLRRRFRAVDTSLIQTRPTGYLLRLGPHRLDLAEFRGLTERGRTAAAAGEHTTAVAALDQALSLWRGPALADLADAYAGEVREALHRERLAAAEAKLAAALALEDYDTVLREVEPLVAENPYAERLYRRQMLALAGVGRRADALAVYRRAYRRLVDDIGVEPGPLLRNTEREILWGWQAGRATASSGPPAPRQLPRAAALTGRGPLLDRIVGQLDGDAEASPVVLLVGPGGVGKSSLALMAGHRLTRAFPDGQLYADLRGSQDTPADPYQVLERFLRALGVNGTDMPRDPEERVTLYRSQFARGRMLVVLDDAADEAQVRPLLPGAGAAVVTSRWQLGELLNVARFVVPPLRTADAIRLLASGVGAARIAAEPQAAQEIVRLCGGLPLAVCIVAARLALRPDAGLDELRRRLGTQRGRLDEPATGNLDVRATIALSHESLPADTRMLFLRSGLLGTADWPEWVAQALLDATGERARALLDQLADVHLVEPLGRDVTGQERYRLHGLVAEYARERCTSDEAPAERDRALKRLLNGWLALAGEAGERLGHRAGGLELKALPPAPDSGVRAMRSGPLNWFETERAGLVAGVDQACRSGLPDLAGGLALSLSRLLGNRPYSDDWEHTLRQAMSCVRAFGADRLLVRLLGGLYDAHLHRDEYAQLPAIAAEQLSVARRLGDSELEVRSLRNAGLAAVRLGRFGEAFDWLEQAVTAARSRAVPDWLLCDTLDGLGFANWEAGDAAAAVPLLEEALALDGAAGRSLQVARVRYRYGLALIGAGRLADAERALAAALRTSQEVGDDLGTAYVEQALADAEIRQGRWPEAAARLGRALSGHQQVGRPDGLAETLRSMGDLAAAEGRWAEAIGPLRQALAIWRRIGAAPRIARVSARLERISAAAGDHAAAAAYRRQWRSAVARLNVDDAVLNLPPFLARHQGIDREQSPAARGRPAGNTPGTFDARKAGVVARVDPESDGSWSGLLSGMVSDEAAMVFGRLLSASQLPVGHGPGMLDLDEGPGRELLDAGVINITGSGDARFARTVHPSLALRRLLDRQHRKLAELQQQLGRVWEQFAGMMLPTTGLAHGPIDDQNVRVIRDYPEMARLASGLYRSPKRMLRATLNGHFVDGAPTHGVLLPPADAIAAGVEFRMIYDAIHVSDPWGSYSVEQSVQAGEQARVRKQVPIKMMHVDDAVALVTIDATGAAGALHIHSTALLELLAEWFDLLWHDPGSVVVGGGADEAELTGVQQKVLRLLASGLTDEAISHRTGTAVRTVRRHVGAILKVLGADSRFQAGVAAAKRGWL